MKIRRGDGETRRHGEKVPVFPRSPTHRLSVSVPSVLHPSKRLGQNFLVDKRVIQRIVAALEPIPQETIIEIGPGTGALTSELVKRAGRVIALEFDRRLGPLLRASFGPFPNFELIEGNALEADFCSAMHPAQHARLVANLPYNISSAILQRLIEQRRCLSEMVLMLQKEVVERMTAPAGSSERGYLSVLIEAYAEAEKLFDVNPASFRPAPKVWSSVVRLIVRQHMQVEVPDEKLFWSVVSAGFAQRRKTIFNNLRRTGDHLQERIKRNGGASIVLCRANVDLRRRAETLSLEEWARIVRSLDSSVSA
jgi:16S rRNA (adenine1518-N6/adenine1519-N6)-dimethyltransferase